MNRRPHEQSDFDGFLDLLWHDIDVSGTPRGQDVYLALYPRIREAVLRELEDLRRTSYTGPPDMSAAERGLLTAASLLGKRFRLRSRVGEGPQSTVWLAEDLQSGDHVAVKLFAPGRRFDATAIRRVEHDTERCTGLGDAGICVPIHIALDRREPYIVMPFIEGPSIARFIEMRRSGLSILDTTELPRAIGRVRDATAARSRTPADPTDGRRRAPGPRLPDAPEVAAIVRFFERAAHTMIRVHEAGMRHRNIKPANIAIGSDGSPVIMDFGFAPAETGDADGDEAEAATIDVGALSSVLYESLTLTSPAAAPKRPAHQENTAIPPELGSLLQRAIGGAATGRYDTMVQFAAALAALRLEAPER